jgi:hypothetical protein
MDLQNKIKETVKAATIMNLCQEIRRSIFQESYNLIKELEGEYANHPLQNKST